MNFVRLHAIDFTNLRTVTIRIGAIRFYEPYLVPNNGQFIKTPNTRIVMDDGAEWLIEEHAEVFRGRLVMAGAKVV